MSDIVNIYRILIKTYAIHFIKLLTNSLIISTVAFWQIPHATLFLHNLLGVKGKIMCCCSSVFMSDWVYPWSLYIQKSIDVQVLCIIWHTMWIQPMHILLGNFHKLWTTSNTQNTTKAHTLFLHCSRNNDKSEVCTF